MIMDYVDGLTRLIILFRFPNSFFCLGSVFFCLLPSFLFCLFVVVEMCEVVANFDYNRWSQLSVDPEAQFQRTNGDETFECFRTLFIKHNVQHTFGLTLLHRHFDMQEGEFLVEKFVDGKSLTSPERLQEGAVFIPHSWEVMKKNGTVMLNPLEYMELTEATSSFAIAGWKQYEAFMVELHHLLSQLGLLEVLGLHRLHRDAIMKPSPDQHLMETTIHGSRCSIVSCITYAEVGAYKEVTPTNWEFASNPKEAVIAVTCRGRHGCQSCCGGY